MGQQQLLLLILGIIAVSAALVIGIRAFDENRQKSHEDNEMVKIMDFATQAQAWKAKPGLIGGGRDSAPADYSEFTVEMIGLTPSGGPTETPYVEIPGAGCFRFFGYSDRLRINALNEDCVIGSWTKGVDVTGPTSDDIVWSFREGS